MVCATLYMHLPTAVIIRNIDSKTSDELVLIASFGKG